MNFKFSNIQNRETLLAKYSEEEIMEAIMGQEVEEERFCSPFRNDQRPTCSLWRAPGNGQLYFMDWATLNDPVDVFGLYMYVYGGDFIDALEGIWQLMSGVASGNNSQVKSIRVKSLSETNLTATVRDWSDSDLLWWKGFGIVKSTLILFNVHPAKQVWLGEDLIYQYSSPAVFPGYIYVGKDSLKVYFPFREKYRFYHNNASYLQGLEQLPGSGRLVVITKSQKDVMLLFQYGVPSVAPQSESIIVSKDQLSMLRERFTHVVALFDNDRAGLIALRKYKSLGMKIFMLRRMDAKDITDYYKKFGADNTRDLISKTKETYGLL